MKISDILLDFLSETAVYEMVRNRQRVFDKLRNKSEILQDHLIKILMFGKNIREYPGWVSELKAFSGEIIDAVSRYKRKTGKELTHSQLYDVFIEYTDTLGKVKNITDDLRNDSWRTADKNKLPRMNVIQEHTLIHKQLRDILSEISVVLAQRNIPDFEIIFDRYL